MRPSMHLTFVTQSHTLCIHHAYFNVPLKVSVVSYVGIFYFTRAYFVIDPAETGYMHDFTLKLERLGKV